MKSAHHQSRHLCILPNAQIPVKEGVHAVPDPSAPQRKAIVGKNAMQEQMDRVPVRAPLFAALLLIEVHLNVQRVWQEGCGSRGVRLGGVMLMHVEMWIS